MPLFEYRCSDCERVFERLVLGAVARIQCPTCGGEQLERLLSMSSLSSDQTRRRASRDVRAKHRAIRRDQAVEEVRRLESHGEDHE